jgi:hypothetical protein
MKIVLLTILFSSLVTGVAVAESGHETWAARELSEGEIIPTDSVPGESFKSWSLFLICNPSWLTDSSSKNIEDLHRAYLGFGRAIGAHHVAIWFWKRKFFGDNELVQNMDADRNVAFCESYGLSPSQSPYIILTTTYPDEQNPALGTSSDFWTLPIGSLDNQGTINVLTSLTDQIFQTRAFDLNFTNEIGSIVYWQEWMSILRRTAQNVGSFASSLEFSANTPIGEITIRSKG